MKRTIALSLVMMSLSGTMATGVAFADTTLQHGPVPVDPNVFVMKVNPLFNQQQAYANENYRTMYEAMNAKPKVWSDHSVDWMKQVFDHALSSGTVSATFLPATQEKVAQGGTVVAQVTAQDGFTRFTLREYKRQDGVSWKLNGTVLVSGRIGSTNTVASVHGWGHLPSYNG